MDMTMTMVEASSHYIIKSYNRHLVLLCFVLWNNLSMFHLWNFSTVDLLDLWRFHGTFALVKSGKRFWWSNTALRSSSSSKGVGQVLKDGLTTPFQEGLILMAEFIIIYNNIPGSLNHSMAPWTLYSSHWVSMATAWLRRGVFIV